MKIRIKSSSIRYRLSQSDVAALVEKKQVEDSVDFGINKLVYSLQIVDDYQLSATFNNNTITLFMPATMLAELSGTDKVGFENIRHLPHLLVEKDFTCLDNVAEDQSDNYPNPLAVKKS